MNMASILRSLSASASGTSQNSVHSHASINDAHSHEPHYLYDGMSQLHEILDAVDSTTLTQHSTECEANLVMDLVRAKREVIRAQKALADSILRENEVLTNLLRFKAEETGKRLNDTDMGLGYMRVIFKKSGWDHLPQPEGHGRLHEGTESAVGTLEEQCRGIAIQLD